ncbi:MAG: hypothetical protein V3571_04970 [Pseudodesulfovibrio sp.]
MGHTNDAPSARGGKSGPALALLLAPLLLFIGLKVALNTDALGTDTIRPLDTTRLSNVGSRLAYTPPFTVFGDLTDGMYPAAKVFEDGKRLGVSVDWHRDLSDQGMGRTFHQSHRVIFSTSDNTHPLHNGRSYAVACNPLAWLNVDWLTLGLLGALWLGLGRLRDDPAADRLRRAPGLWLALFLADRFATLVSSPNFALSLVPDSGSYTILVDRFDSLKGLLSAFRTAGYPAFYAVTPDALIPAVQLALLFGGVYVVYLGLRALSPDGWAPLAACLPLLTLNGVYRLDAIAFSHLLLPDVPALAMGLLAVGGCLLLFRDETRRGWRLGLCGLAVFCAYQLKPSYLFLVACLPGMALGWVALCRRADWKAALTSVVLPLVLVVAVPLVAFCGLRLAVVGQFGLVSAGGRQLIGLAGNFLDQETAGRVSEGRRAMARDVAGIIREKKALAPAGATGERLYRHIFRTYDWIIYGNGELGRYCGGMACDEQLGALSREVLALHPDRYLSWLAASAKDSAGRVVLLGRWRLAVLAGLGLSLAFFCAALLRARSVVGIGRGLREQLLGCDMKMIAWTFVCLSVPSLLVVILVAIPYSRYLLPTRILFLPLCLYLAGTLFRGGVRLWRAVPEK